MTQPIGQLIYIASPYTDANNAVLEMRFVEAVNCCGWLMNNYRDKSFYSPIAHTHPVALRCTLPIEWEFWSHFDECMLSRCNQLWVLTIPGWSKSTGVTAEIRIAREFGLPILYIVPAYSYRKVEYVLQEEPPQVI